LDRADDRRTNGSSPDATLQLAVADVASFILGLRYPLPLDPI
jgi:hypothetical protein